MMKPEEYMKHWKGILAAADADDDIQFLCLYINWLKETDQISRERQAILKMSIKLLKRFICQ